MTLPASGPITIGMVAAELGISLPLSLGDPRVRALAGGPSGPISLGQLRGKSTYTPMTVTANGASNSVNSAGGAGTIQAFPSVAVSGGSGGKSYAWEVVSSTNSPVVNGLNTASPQVSKSYAQNANGSASARMRCAVTDATGATVLSNTVDVTLEWQGDV